MALKEDREAFRAAEEAEEAAWGAAAGARQAVAEGRVWTPEEEAADLAWMKAVVARGQAWGLLQQAERADAYAREREAQAGLAGR